MNHEELAREIEFARADEQTIIDILEIVQQARDRIRMNPRVKTIPLMAAMVTAVNALAEAYQEAERRCEALERERER